MDDDFTLAATDVPHTIGALDAGQSYSVVFTVVVSGICAETVTYTETKCTRKLYSYYTDSKIRKMPAQNLKRSFLYLLAQAFESC